jgi:hypothetical protein
LAIPYSIGIFCSIADGDRTDVELQKKHARHAENGIVQQALSFLYLPDFADQHTSGI